MGKRYGKDTKKHNLAGKLPVFAQFLFSAVLLGCAGASRILPGKYMLILVLILLLMLLFAFGLQLKGGGLKIVGTAISLVVCIASAFVTSELFRVNRFLDRVSGAEYKVDDMAAVVRKDDPAQSLEDAADYIFGIQTMADKENTAFMREEIENKTGKEIRIKEYLTLAEMAKALLEGQEIDAAIYNSAFTPLIDESIEGYSDKVRAIFRHEIKKAVDINIENKYENTACEEEQESSFNIYVSGIDTKGSVSVTSRSDVNIIITVNPKTKHILLTSTPRDYYVPIPEVSGGSPDKLTHAGLYGPDASMRTLQSLYGIDFSYYARVNFTSFINVVNALGGIDVYSEYPFSAGGYYFKKGMNYMDGHMALAFARERHSFLSGDNQRGKNQEAVLTAIINKALSPAILNKAGRILASVSKCVETNMTKDEILKYVNDQLDSGAKWDIQSQAVIGSGSSKPCYSMGSRPLFVLIPNEESVAEASAKIREVMDEKAEE